MTDEKRIEEVEEKLGYTFCDKEILLAALTHASYANGREGVEDNQRLEFLGDAVIGLLVAEKLYSLVADRDEGFLTTMRSKVVSGEALAEIARGLDLGTFMRFSAGVKDENERKGNRTLAALCEAILGAIWLDGGLNAVVSVFEKLFLESIERQARERETVILDPRGELQQQTRKLGLGEPGYELMETIGEDGRNFMFRVRVRAGKYTAEGVGTKKRKAAAAAAEALLRDLKSIEKNKQREK